MMIYPWQWAWFICRRFFTLLVCVLKPQLEREYLNYHNTPFMKNVLKGEKVLTGTYQQAINRVVIDKQRLLLLFLNSSLQTEQVEKLKQFIEDSNNELHHELNEEQNGEGGLVYYVVEVNDYYGWLLACKLQVFAVPTTLLIGPGNVGPRVLERHLNKLHFNTPTGLPSTQNFLPMTLLQEQAVAFERSMRNDLLRQRQKRDLEDRQEKYLKLLSDFVVQEASGEDVFKLAIQMPDGKRLSKLVKADAPLSTLFAIVRKEREEMSQGKVSIKSIDPAITLHEDDDKSSPSSLAESSLSRMQKLFVEWDD